MFKHLRSPHYDTYHPNLSHSLADLIRRYIKFKPKHEKEAPEFIDEVRRHLFFLHEYNMQVTKLRCKYPRSRQFDLLLVQYVELEFELLYSKQTKFSKKLELLTEKRVLLLLQVMLYKAVLTNKTLINEKNDLLLKKAVLRILANVKSEYFVENKLINNIVHKLLKKVVDVNIKLNNSRSITNNLDDLFVHNSPKRLTTSDYGSDGDSDCEQNLGLPFSPGLSASSEPTDNSSCIEVPLTVNGFTPVPTIDFVDDENYMVYLQRRLVDDQPQFKEPVLRFQNDDNDNFLNYLENQLNLSKNRSCDDNPVNNCTKSELVVLSSDSEDEDCLPDTSSKKAGPVKKSGVVTFEIFDDDDDDDNGQSNYMVYMQKEVETNKRVTSLPTDQIIVCLDSEDEDDGIVKVEAHEKSIEAEVNVEVTEGKSDSISLNVCEEETVDDLLEFVSSKDSPISNSNSESNNLKTVCDNVETNFSYEVKLGDEPNNLISDCPDQVVYSPSFLNMHPPYESSENGNLKLDDDVPSPNTAVNPDLIFNNFPLEDVRAPEAVNGSNQLTNHSITAERPLFNESELETLQSLGGPVLCEVNNDLNDVDNLLECRLNDSLLELLIDDSYFANDEEAFQQLECFLFNNSEEQELSSQFSAINNRESLAFPFDELAGDCNLFTDNINMIHMFEDVPQSDNNLKSNKRSAQCCEMEKVKTINESAKKFKPLVDFTNKTHHEEPPALYDNSLGVIKSSIENKSQFSRHQRKKVR